MTPRQSLLIPTGFFLFVAATFLLAGLKTELPYFLWQVLPLEALLDHPFESLLLLHGQPPFVNVLVLIFYRFEALTGIHHDSAATVFMLAVAWLFCWLFFQMAFKMSGSVTVSCVVGALLVTNPGFVRHMQGLYYTPIVPVEILLVLFATHRFLREPRRRTLAWLVLALSLVVYTRSVWHPLFGFVVLLLVFPRGGMVNRRRLMAEGIGAYALLTGAWMLKNAILFGSFSFSTWLGFNLGGHETTRFVEEQSYDEAIVRDYYSPGMIEWFADKPAVAMVKKNIDLPPEAASIGTNMNHFAVPALGAADVRTRLGELLGSPRALAERVFMHLSRFDAATYANAYLIDAKTGLYDPVPVPSPLDAVLRLHDQLYYGSWLRPLWALRFGGYTWRPSFNFLVLLPLSLWGGYVVARRGADGETRRLAAVALFLVGWFVAMMLLIDGRESNRIRWEIEPALLILLGAALSRIRARVSASQP